VTPSDDSAAAAGAEAIWLIKIPGSGLRVDVTKCSLISTDGYNVLIDPGWAASCGSSGVSRARRKDGCDPLHL
jgi:hypothetical protein